MNKNYNRTKRACYIGFITQAITVNFAPLLFLKFHEDYDISLGNIALISTCFFLMQIIVDLICVKFVDRIGYRKCIVASEVFASIGLIGLAILPDILPNPFAGIMICVGIYAIGSGLIEVVCGPIMEACPFENKEASMSLMHSFYCWGVAGTIILTTIFLNIFGMDSWKIVAVLWAIIPAVNIYNFATCPIEHLVEDGEGMSTKEVLHTPYFWYFVCLMICAGAAELSIAQWASAYAESALGLNKVVGDLAGPCMFAIAQGISRLIFGKKGSSMDLKKYMLSSGILCLACYITIALFDNPLLGLIACIACGFSVGIMWPGTISLASKAFPLGGTVMFALLAVAGDFSGSVGPWIVGQLTHAMGDNIRIGLSIGCIFPLTMVIALLLRKNKKE